MASDRNSSSSDCCSPEYGAVLECTEDLMNAVSQCIPSVTSACLAKHLISEDVAAYTYTNNLNTDKASHLLTCVRKTIQNESSKFTVFVEVLQANPYLKSTADVLQERYSKIQTGSQSRKSLTGVGSSSPEIQEDSVFRRDSEPTVEKVKALQNQCKGQKLDMRRGSSIDSAISEMSNTTRSSISSSKAGVIDEDEDSSACDVARESLARIKGSFTTLVINIADKLKEKDIDMAKVRLHIATRFSPGDIVSNSRNIVEVCEALSQNGLWDYYNYSPIEGIAMIAGDDPELKKLIDRYKAELNGFKATTKIAAFIKECDDEDDIAESGQSIQQDMARYDKRYCRKLTVKLKKARITEETLIHVDQFWMSIADDFLIPPLSVLLDSIHEGCVEITWHIPTLSALQVQANSNQDSREFFQKQEISRLTIDEEVLYDEEMSEEEFSDVLIRTQRNLEASLIAAAKEGNLLDTERLLTVNISPNVKEMDECGWTALLWACRKCHGDVVDLLISHGANVNIEDSSKWTGLILSSWNGDLHTVKKLLDSGADVNKCTNDFWNALMWTAEKGHTEVAKLLLERGAKTDMRDKAGFTPLLQASQDGNLGIVELLVEYDKEMDINQKTNNGWSAVMLATKNGHEAVVRYLVDHGCDAQYQRDEDEITALHIASYKKNNNLVRYLCLDQKLTVNIQDEDGLTSLMYASKRGNYEVVRTLVENGHADLNIRENDSDWTALFFAMEGQHNDVLVYLLRTGRVDPALLDSPDKYGNSIIELAQEWNPAVVPLLTQYKETQLKRQRINPSLALPVTMKTGVAKSISKENYKILKKFEKVV